MQTGKDDGRPRARSYKALLAGCFFLLAALNLLRGEWLGAVFFLSGGLILLERQRIDRWPKAARYLVVLALGALGAAMLFRIAQRLLGGG